MQVEHSSPGDLAHLVSLVSSVPAAIMSVSLDRCFLSWNAAAEKIFGFSAQEILGANLMTIVPDDRWEEALGFFARVKQGETFSVETFRRHKTGRLVAVSMHLGPILDARGCVLAACAVAHDITDREKREAQRQLTAEGKQGEAAMLQPAVATLEASVRDFRTFFETVNVGNVIADARSLRFLRVNRCFCELTGYTAEELAGLSAYDLTDPADVERDRSGWEQSVRELAPCFAIEKRYRRKDGSTIWVHVTSTLVRNALGEPLHVIGVIRDVTDRRQAMDELHKTRAELESRVLSRTAELAAATEAARESARRLELLIDNSPLAMVSLDAGGLVQLWNPAAERLFGWSAREVLGQTMPHLPLTNRAHYEEELRTVLTSPGQRCWETQRLRRDGSMIDVEVWRVALSSPDPGGDASIAIIVDVTERKFLERALLEASERESRRIGQELHDNLCQHLLGAAFSAKAVAMGQPADLPVSAELHNLARLINSAVQQTRDIARGLNPVEMDSAGLMTALQALADRPRTEMACRLECNHNVLLLDAGVALHAYRIAQEAVANAMQHSGGTEIVIRLTEEDANIVLQIEDNGTGFEFHPTQRQGLGLEIMKYRAHAISGKNRLNTAQGRGTNVTLVLPK